MNEQFLDYLSKYEIKDMFLDDLLQKIVDSFDSLNEANKNHEQEMKAYLNDLQKKIDTVEEKYLVSGEMTKETYEKFMAKFAEEKAEILSTLRNTAVTSSNLENYLETVASFSSKLATTWNFSVLKKKKNFEN